MFEKVTGGIVRTHDAVDPAVCQGISEKVFDVVADRYEGLHVPAFIPFRFGGTNLDHPTAEFKDADPLVVTITGTEREFLRDVQNRFFERSNEIGVPYGRVGSSICFGTPLGEKSWHVDIDTGHRLVLNLSDAEYELEYANTWRSLELKRNKNGIFVRGAELITDTTVETCKQGEGLVIDNTVRLLERVPHTGHVTPRKLFFRANTFSVVD